MATGGIAILNHEQLRRLARVIYFQEVEAIQQLKLPSELEVAKYIRDSRDNYLSALALLDLSEEFLRKFDDDQVKASIARDIYYYIRHSINIALQSVRNYRLRSEYLTKIKNHADELMQRVETSTTEEEIEELAKQALEFRNHTMDYIRELQSSVSQEFSIFLKETGLTYAELVERYQARLNFSGKFEDLEDIQKIQVYEAIIEASGRGNPGVYSLAKGIGSLGLAVLVFIAALIVWDVFSSEHPVRTATEDSISAVTYIGGAMLGEEAGIELTTSLASWMGAEAPSLLLIGVGLVGSIAGAFLLALFAGFLTGFLLSRRTTPPTASATEHYYHAPMTDAEALAWQILHLDNFPSVAHLKKRK